MRYKLNFEITIINKNTLLNQAIEFANKCSGENQPYFSNSYIMTIEVSDEPTREKVDTIVKSLRQCAEEVQTPGIEIVDIKYQSCEAIIE